MLLDHDLPQSTEPVVSQFCFGSVTPESKLRLTVPVDLVTDLAIVLPGRIGLQ
jgi:hypothetical protein